MGGSSVGLAKRGCYRCAGIDLRCNACREDLFLYPRPRIKNMFFNSYVQTSALTLAWLVMGGAGLAFGEVESKRASISRLVGQVEQNAQRASRISFTATFSIEQVAPAGSGVPRFIRGKASQGRSMWRWPWSRNEKSAGGMTVQFVKAAREAACQGSDKAQGILAPGARGFALRG